MSFGPVRAEDRDMRKTQASLALLRRTVPDGVIRSGELRTAGVPSSTLSTWCRPGGPWQRLLPGVLLLATGTPTPRQRLRAAVTYGGDCVITGWQALREHGLPLPDDESTSDEVHLLIATQRRLAARAYVTVERTTRMPEPRWRDGLPFAPVPRAAVDAARRTQDPALLRRLLVGPVRAGLCTMAELRAELDAGGQRGTAAPRALLAEVMREVFPIASARARRLLAQTPLPPPVWDVALYTDSGVPLGVVDAWWSEVALAWDFGGQTARGRTGGTGPGVMAAAGATVLRTPPQRLHGDPEGVLRQLVAAFLRAAQRPRPPLCASVA
jgi:hypothetical protein